MRCQEFVNLSSKCNLSYIRQFYFLIRICWQFDTRRFGIIRAGLGSSHSHPRVTGHQTETVMNTGTGWETGEGPIPRDHRGNEDVSQTQGPINNASSFLFYPRFNSGNIYSLQACDASWRDQAPSDSWVQIVDTEQREMSWALSLTPSLARGDDKQIGLIWNFIAEMMTLTRSVEHHQKQIKPDLRSHTLVVIPKNLKNISWSWSSDSARSRCFQSLISNGLSTIFGGWSFVKWGGLLIL